MDKIMEYRRHIQQILKQYQAHQPASKEVTVQLITDTAHDHYQVYYVGWQNDRRVHGCLLHLDICDGKVWIQYNGTEESVADKLVEMGVPKEDIVLGFYPAYYRELTDYAVS
jgi:hypothetical protein